MDADATAHQNRAYDGKNNRRGRRRYYVFINDTPISEFKFCNDLGGIINLDDITHIEAVEKACGKLPKK